MTEHIKQVDFFLDQEKILEDFIQHNCRELNYSIGCYCWEDYEKDRNFKQLILYSADKEYKLAVHKRILRDRAAFEEKIMLFLKKVIHEQGDE